MIITHADAGVKRLAASVCASVCLFVCLSACPHDNSETTKTKAFKLGVWNDLGTSYK